MSQYLRQNVIMINCTLLTAEIIKWQKCARMGLNGFHIRLIFGTLCNKKNQILGAVLELPAKQHCQSSPFTSKLAKLALLTTV